MLPFAVLTSLLLPSILALPLESRQSGPSVSIADGTVVGSSTNNVNTFKGIPFAQPPVGPLRLKAPQPLNSSFGTFDATQEPKACPQFINIFNPDSLPADAVDQLLNSPLLQQATNQGEDCLTVNVQRPAGVAEDAKLPVLFWIFGGGFELGWSGMYDGSSIVERSVQMGKPIIYVAVNYRVNGFGFLAGKELADDGSTNLGLRDQRLGLQWVADNIAAFGGDPEKVTIWGESAGAISVMDHTIINGGDNAYKGQPLFRAAIMNSGTMIPANEVTTSKAQNIYDSVVENAGCGDASDTLTCLREADYQTFLNAVTAVPGIFSYRSLDLSYLPRPDPNDNFFPQSPEAAIQAGAFAKVPLIAGDQEDEGTLFSLTQSNITTNSQLIAFLTSYFPESPTASADITTLSNLYPDQPLLGQPAGSPFNTGPLNNIYPQYKRLAALLGDISFTLTRRVYLQYISSQVQCWSYLSSYLYGTPVLGTFHGKDIIAAYGLLGDTNVATTSIQSYYVNFVNFLDPNGEGVSAPLVQWPQWTGEARRLLNFRALRNTIINDDFRKPASYFLAERGSALRI